MVKASLDMQTILKTSVACETGPVREQNEDNIAVASGSDCGFPEKGSILVVADGMGGLRGGEIASSTVTRELPQLYFQSTNINTAEALVQSISEVNRMVYRSSFNFDPDRSMGSTVVAAVVTKEILVTANVGDSRAYLFRSGKLRQLSKDHSLRNEHFSMFETGAGQNCSHVLTQAIGPLPDVTPHVSMTRLVPEDIILLCSDGLSSFVPDRDIRELLSEVPFDEATELMLELVAHRRGDDNLSIILSKVSFHATQV